MAYKNRIVEKQANRYLQAAGGIVLEGPRGCGKTSTAKQLAKSAISLDESPETARAAQLSPQSIMGGDTPRLIDEWQLAPNIWNAVRHEIDSRQEPGQFILSGSATPADDITRHTGIGRLAYVRMRPMTLCESTSTAPQISLSALLEAFRAGEALQIAGQNPFTYEDLAELLARSGWPQALDKDFSAAVDVSRLQVEHIVREQGAQGVRRERTRRLLRALARRIGQPEVLARLAAELSGNDPLVPETVRLLLDRLEAIFMYEPLAAWSPALRSRSRVTTKPVIHFADPALALAVLRARPERLVLQPEFFGQLFESMVVRDLRVFAQHSAGEVFFYRDNTGLEVDAVLDFGDCWAGVEVKLGGDEVPKAEQNLLRFAERVDVDVVGKPAFLAVVTATQFAYTLESGVHVIPLPCLGM